MKIIQTITKNLYRVITLVLALGLMAIGSVACSNSNNPMLLSQEAGDSPEQVDPSSVTQPPPAETAQDPVISNPPDALANPNDRPVVVVSPTFASTFSSRGIGTHVVVTLPSADDSSGNGKGVATTVVAGNKLVGSVPSSRQKPGAGDQSVEALKGLFDELVEANPSLVRSATGLSHTAHENLERVFTEKDVAAFNQFLESVDALTEKMEAIRNEFQNSLPRKKWLILEDARDGDPQQDRFVGDVQRKLLNQLNGQSFFDVSALGDAGTRLIRLYKASTYSYKNENGSTGTVSFFDFSHDTYQGVVDFQISFLTDAERGL